MSVVELKVASATRIDDDLIAGLEALLSFAKEGRIQGIAYVTVETHGIGQYSGVGTGWRGHLGGVHIPLGGLAILSNRLITETTDDTFAA